MGCPILGTRGCMHEMCQGFVRSRSCPFLFAFEPYGCIMLALLDTLLTFIMFGFQKSVNVYVVRFAMICLTCTQDFFFRHTYFALKIMLLKVMLNIKCKHFF